MQISKVSESRRQWSWEVFSSFNVQVRFNVLFLVCMVNGTSFHECEFSANCRTFVSLQWLWLCLSVKNRSHQSPSCLQPNVYIHLPTSLLAKQSHDGELTATTERSWMHGNNVREGSNKVNLAQSQRNVTLKCLVCHFIRFMCMWNLSSSYLLKEVQTKHAFTHFLLKNYLYGLIFILIWKIWLDF